MTPLVVDASVALAWVLPLPSTGAATALAATGVGLVAPALMRTEFASALWKQARFAGLARDDAVAAVGRLERMGVLYVDGQALDERALAIACETGRSVYDCCYVALAEAEGTSVVTADRRLVNGLAATRYAPLVRAL